MTDYPQPEHETTDHDLITEARRIATNYHARSLGLEGDDKEAGDLLTELADRLEERSDEADHWERQYDELLAAAGGVWPGP